MSVATHAAHSAHPYVASAAASRRSARRASLPPPPPGAGYHTAPPPALPSYSRHDRPGGEVRTAKVDRTRQWVAQTEPAPAPPTSLQSFGYLGMIGGEPPVYDDARTGPTSPARPTPSSHTKHIMRPVGASSAPVTPENKAPRKAKPTAGGKAKSVFRMLVGNKAGDEPYAPLGDNDSFMNMSR